jgi:hypothetical protein
LPSLFLSIFLMLTSPPPLFLLPPPKFSLHQGLLAEAQKLEGIVQDYHVSEQVWAMWGGEVEARVTVNLSCFANAAGCPGACARNCASFFSCTCAGLRARVPISLRAGLLPWDSTDSLLVMTFGCAAVNRRSVIFPQPNDCSSTVEFLLSLSLIHRHHHSHQHPSPLLTSAHHSILESLAGSQIPSFSRLGCESEDAGLERAGRLRIPPDFLYLSVTTL